MSEPSNPVIDDAVDKILDLAGRLMPGEPMTDETYACEIAARLTVTLVHGGPVARLRGLCRVLRILRLACALVAGQRDHVAACATAVYSQRRLASHVGVTASTVQGWITSGEQSISRMVDHAPLHRWACLI